MNTETKVVHASESGHWYAQDGTPMYTIKGKNGKERNTTLRDARKLNLFPSVTTVTGMWASPGLESWKLNQAYLAAATSPHKRSEMDADKWIELVRVEAEKHAKDAAIKGKRLHHVATMNPISSDGKRFAVKKITAEEIKILYGVRDCICKLGITITDDEKTFSHRAGYGGAMDKKGKDANDKLCYLDIKTKEFTLKDGKPFAKGKPVKLAWPENCMQLAAYCYGDGTALCDARLINLYVSVTELGLVVAHEWTLDEAEEELEMFFLALRGWQIRKKYKPEWESVA